MDELHIQRCVDGFVRSAELHRLDCFIGLQKTEGRVGVLSYRHYIENEDDFIDFSAQGIRTHALYLVTSKLSSWAGCR